jgi:CRISPR/Cas system-associated exonuclease Cas4 (RecB family)
MEPFLKELADRIIRGHLQLDSLTVVFPNRRAILYFKRYLSQMLNRPAFAPQLLTIEDFMASFSTLRVPDKLELVYHLYSVYESIVHVDEPFDKFYFWGEMLLRDFDEVDKYGINATLLFKDLSVQKEMDATFDYLSDEQKDFLKRFWASFDENVNESKKKFLGVWKDLPLVYENFRRHLREKGLAYEGMLHREVADQINRKEAGQTIQFLEDRHVLFVGFNALTQAEESVIEYCLKWKSAEVVWDLDEYYVNNEWQEAGTFFRQLQHHPILGKTFPEDVVANFTKKKTIRVLGASQHIGQSKFTAHVLAEELAKGMDPEETLIVLPDERLLFPVLHSVAGVIEKLNVTMGFPLSSTPLFNLVELLMEMQINCLHDSFNHRQVLALLGHPYGVAAGPSDATAKRKEILKSNWVNVPREFLQSGPELFRLMFRETLPGDMVDYLRKIMLSIGSNASLSGLDKEFAFFFIKLLNRIEQVVHPESSSYHTGSRKEQIKSFLRLFRQLVRSEKIPFTGEPLEGLQIMGVLETRNLDFKNVFILSLNEGAFPAFGNKGSYIPYSLRRAYGLPTIEHQDAIYAYLFYRAIQRAENVFLVYNSETDILGQGEMSRYLQQLLFESGHKPAREILHTPAQPRSISAIDIKKDERVFNMLARYCVDHQDPRPLTPTALNDYIECRLKFYFRHVSRIKEADEIEEELNARMVGNFLHAVMESYYAEITSQKESSTITSSDLTDYEKRIDAILNRVFIKEYGLDPSKPVLYHGQRLVVKEVVKRFVDRIIAKDKVYAPFKMEAIEKRDLRLTLQLDAEGHPTILLGGTIDRADSKDGLLRVIDYKTGKDTADIKGGIQDLFEREGKRNKAAFQTMLYALLYASNPKTSGYRIVPGLMNRMNLFDPDFRFGLQIGKEYVQDVRPFLPEFETGLKAVLEELYDPDVPFTQTQDTEVCRICAYREICYR